MMKAFNYPAKPKFTKRPIVLAIALALSSGSAFSDNYFWVGQGTDASSATLNNWGILDGTPLVDVPVIGNEDFLYFGLTPAIPVQVSPDIDAPDLDANPLTAEPLAVRGLNFYANTTIGGDALLFKETTLYPYQAVISASNSAVVINNDIFINQRLAGSTLQENVNLAMNNSSLTLNGNITALPNILLSFASQNNSSLNINGVVKASALNVTNSGSNNANSLVNINGTVNASSVELSGPTNNINGLVNAPTVKLSGTTTVAGVSGAIKNDVAQANPALPPVATAGTITFSKNANLVVDNTINANTDRIGNLMDLNFETGSAFTLIGNAVTAVTEKIGDLSISNIQNSIQDQPFTLAVNTSGADTVLDIDKINLDAKSRLVVSSNVALGSTAKIKIADVSNLTQVGGILNDVSVNSQEFATYDAVNGLKSATTKNDFNGAVAADNIYVNTNQALAGNASINSLALGANVTGSSADTITVASGKVLIGDQPNEVLTVAQRLAFGTQKADIKSFGSSEATITGGVTGTGGLLLSGAGLTLGSSGSMTGTVDVIEGSALRLSADNALQGADINLHSSSLSIGSTIQSVKSLYVDYGYNSYSSFSGNGVINATGNIVVRQSVIDATFNSNATVQVGGGVMNGDINAKTVDAYASVQNGNITATDNIHLSGTANGVLAGSATLSGYGGTLTNTNTYTGNTNTYSLALRDNGSILNSASIDGSISLINDVAHSTVNRIGDAAEIKGNFNLSSSSDPVAFNVTENVGAITVNAESNYVDLSNASGGTTTLQADSLSVLNGGYLFLDKDANSRLLFDVGPTVFAGTNVVKGALTSLSTGGYSWSSYNGTTGLEAISVNSGSLVSTPVDQFVRITNASDGQLNGNQTVMGVDVDTTDTLNGSGTLTLATGQMLLSQSNTINYSAINFGSNEGLISATGVNTITGQLQGSGGLRKIGGGNLILESSTAFTGNTIFNGGELQVNNGTFHQGNTGYLSLSNAKLILSGAGKLNADTDVSGGTIDLINNAAQTFNNGATVYSTVNINAGSQLGNSGYLESVVNSGSLTSSGRINNLSSSTVASNSGSVTDLDNSGSFNNSGSVTYASNHGTLSNTGTITDMYNSATLINSGTIRHVSNSGVFNNAGNVTVQLSNYGTVNNSNSIVLNYNYSPVHYNDGTIINNNNGSLIITSNDVLTGNGSIVNKGTLNVNAGGELSNDVIQKDNVSAITTINGSYFGDMQIQSGILKGAGIINGNVTVSGTGQVKPGNSPGLLAINGDFNLLSGGILEMELNSLSVFDTLQVSGNLDLHGQVLFKLGEGIDKSIFDKQSDGTFKFTVANFFQGEGGSNIELAVLQGVHISVADSTGTSLGGLTITEDGNVSSVPVPAAAWLMGSALVGLVGAKRRKRIH